jgi:hypothetical protein
MADTPERITRLLREPAADAHQEATEPHRGPEVPDDARRPTG